MMSLKISENIIIKVLLAIKGIGDWDPMEDLTYGITKEDGLKEINTWRDTSETIPNGLVIKIVWKKLLLIFRPFFFPPKELGAGFNLDSLIARRNNICYCNCNRIYCHISGWVTKIGYTLVLTYGTYLPVPCHNHCDNIPAHPSWMIEISRYHFRHSTSSSTVELVSFC